MTRPTPALRSLCKRPGAPEHIRRRGPKPGSSSVRQTGTATKAASSPGGGKLDPLAQPAPIPASVRRCPGSKLPAVAPDHRRRAVPPFRSGCPRRRTERPWPKAHPSSPARPCRHCGRIPPRRPRRPRSRDLRRGWRSGTIVHRSSRPRQACGPGSRLVRGIRRHEIRGHLPHEYGASRPVRAAARSECTQAGAVTRKWRQRARIVRDVRPRVTQRMREHRVRSGIVQRNVDRPSPNRAQVPEKSRSTRHPHRSTASAASLTRGLIPVDHQSDARYVAERCQSAIAASCAAARGLDDVVGERRPGSANPNSSIISANRRTATSQQAISA